MKPMIFNARLVVPVWDCRIRNLCTRPYPNHRKGCPNYGRRSTCPPEQALLDEVFNTTHPFWALWVEFDLAAHVAKLRANHQDWSYRQLSCCLYWQGTVRKFLRSEVSKWVGTRALTVTECPEAMGVDVTATMSKIGVTLEWPPKTNRP